MGTGLHPWAGPLVVGPLQVAWQELQPLMPAALGVLAAEEVLRRLMPRLYVSGAPAPVSLLSPTSVLRLPLTSRPTKGQHAQEDL